MALILAKEEDPLGVFKLVLTSIKKNDGKLGPYLIWNFSIIGNSKFKDRIVTYMTNASLKNHGRLADTLRIFNVDTSSLSGAFDIESLIGKQATGKIELNAKHYPIVTELYPSVEETSEWPK